LVKGFLQEVLPVNIKLRKKKCYKEKGIASAIVVKQLFFSKKAAKLFAKCTIFKQRAIFIYVVFNICRVFDICTLCKI